MLCILISCMDERFSNNKPRHPAHLHLRAHSHTMQMPTHKHKAASTERRAIQDNASSFFSEDQI